MTLDRVVTGTASSFQFNSAAFYPLNGQLLGASSPGINNRYFTMEVRGKRISSIPLVGGKTFHLTLVVGEVRCKLILQLAACLASP